MSAQSSYFINQKQSGILIFTKIKIESDSVVIKSTLESSANCTIGLNPKKSKWVLQIDIIILRQRANLADVSAMATAINNAI